jgi:hypothetical protein
MYTEIVRRPLIALTLVLIVGITPVTGAICALDCDPPTAANTKPACHETPGSNGYQNVRAAAHPCGHHHDDVVAVVTGSSAREGAVSGPALATISHIPLVLTLHSTPVSMTHGPPGSIGRIGSSFNTVLRI